MDWRGHDEFSAQFREDFNTLLRRPYFKRLWIAQEIHGGGMQCLLLVGTSYFSLPDLKDIRDAALATSDFNQRHAKPASTALEMLSMQSQKRLNAKSDMLHLREQRHVRLLHYSRLDSSYRTSQKRSHAESDMLHLRHAQFLLCSDPRDRVYGTLGFYQYGRRKATIVPDYNKSALDLALDLSRSVRINFRGLQHSAEALEIGFHDTQLMPYMAERGISSPVSSTEVQKWCVRFSVCRVIDGLELLKPQDVTRTQETDSPGSSSGKHKACDGAESNDCHGFAAQCDHLLRENRVIKGVACSGERRDEWVLPFTAQVWDTILSTAETDANQTLPDEMPSKALPDLALVVRIGQAATAITVIGFATCIPGSERESMSGATRPRWYDEPWRLKAEVYFEATVEEMVPLAIPQRDNLLHARHAFKLPKCCAIQASPHFSAMS